MKSVEECIGDIGRSGSTIFSTLDLSSGFWQLPLAPESQKCTAFIRVNFNGPKRLKDYIVLHRNIKD